MGSPMKHFVLLSIALYIFWILLSGKMEAKYLLIGLGTAVVAAYISMPLLLIENKKGSKKYFAFDVPIIQYLMYWCWLLKEVYKANIDVEKAVIRPEMAINPLMFTFKMPMDNPMAHATLANSITLTPGTITIDVTEDGVYTIHALTDGAREGLLAGDMQRRVAKLFGETYDYVEEGN